MKYDVQFVFLFSFCHETTILELYCNLSWSTKTLIKHWGDSEKKMSYSNSHYRHAIVFPTLDLFYPIHWNNYMSFLCIMPLYHYLSCYGITIIMHYKSFYYYHNFCESFFIYENTNVYVFHIILKVVLVNNQFCHNAACYFWKHQIVWSASNKVISFLPLQIVRFIHNSGAVIWVNPSWDIWYIWNIW